MFVADIVMGFWAQSTGLIDDSFDMLADSHGGMATTWVMASILGSPYLPLVTGS